MASSRSLRPVALLGLALASACGPRDLGEPANGDASCEVGFDEGSCAPDFALPDGEGGTVRLSDQLGRRVVVAGAAAWCPTCRNLLGDLQDWYGALPEDGPEVINVLVEDAEYARPEAADAAAWREALALDFLVAADVEGDWVRDWSIRQSRHTYTVLDEAGVVVYRTVEYSGQTVEEILAAAEGR